MLLTLCLRKGKLQEVGGVKKKFSLLQLSVFKAQYFPYIVEDVFTFVCFQDAI